MRLASRICGKEINVGGRVFRVASIEGDKFRFLDDPSSVVEGLRICGTRIDLFTFMQRLPQTKPNFDYPMEWDNFAALSISSFDHWWNEVLGFKGRNKAKQAEKKGVKVREIPFDDVLIQGIHKIYNETPVRQGKRFPHYGMKLENVRAYAGTFLDSSVFIGAFYQDAMIGFAKLTMDETNTQAGLMHIVSLVEHREKAPSNALIAQAVKSCADRHIPYLVYSNFAYGNKKSDSLSDFKERNGFQRIDIPRYYVPLTRLGHCALRLGLHRKLLDRLPEPLIEKLRAYRAEWYSRKMQVSR